MGSPSPRDVLTLDAPSCTFSIHDPDGHVLTCSELTPGLSPFGLL